MLQACLNGARTRWSHPALPVTPADLAADAAAVWALGVPEVHVHPRGAGGAESLDHRDVHAAVNAIRAAAPVLRVGVTTGAWIQSDPERRVELTEDWAGPDRPDFASVNVHEDGWLDVCESLDAQRIGIELGVRDAAAADRLRERGLPPGTLRVLVEIPAGTPDPVLVAGRLLKQLTWADAPVLLHGADRGAWPVLTEARARGLDTRIGLEDTLTLPDGTPANSNAALITAAQA
jgi:uncharacterized protein (DUF849 family)